MSKKIVFRDLDQAGRAKIIGAKLQSILAEKGMSIQEFSRRMKVAHGTCSRWVNGQTLPSLGFLDQVAFVLETPELNYIIGRAWKKNCLICDIEFTANSHKGVKIYCSAACKSVSKKLAYGPAKKIKKTPLEAEALLGRLVISEFCNDCSGGDGLCPDRGCGLRPISPLPLAEAAAIASRNSIAASKKMSSEVRAEITRKIWARPGYAERMREEQRNRWNSLTEAQKQNHIEKITLGRWGDKRKTKKEVRALVDETKTRLAHQAASIKTLKKMTSQEISDLGDDLRSLK